MIRRKLRWDCLLSHSDQTQQWMTALPNERSGIGWGGRIADMVNDMNMTQDLSMNISMNGTNIFQTGVNTTEYSSQSSTVKSICDQRNRTIWW